MNTLTVRSPAPTTRRLEGRVAVVTGAASGIGAAVARRFAAEGAGVALLARREDRLRELSEQLRVTGATAVALPADITDAHAWSKPRRRSRPSSAPSTSSSTTPE
jgi:NADP-dependent 3-hydroxy acid dehydrogenase YdfG